MATFLDFGFLSNFSPIFTFIFIFAVLYGIFSYAKFLGDNKSIQALIAFVIAILASISSMVVNIISYMTPWFVLLFFFILFMLLGFKVLGASDKDILSVVKGSNYGGTISWWVIIISIIILIVAISSSVGQKTLKFSSPNESIELVDAGGTGLTPGEAGATATGSFEKNLYNTVFNPKVLGLLVIMMISAIAVSQMAKSYH